MLICKYKPLWQDSDTQLTVKVCESLVFVKYMCEFVSYQDIKCSMKVCDHMVSTYSCVLFIIVHFFYICKDNWYTVFDNLGVPKLWKTFVFTPRMVISTPMCFTVWSKASWFRLVIPWVCISAVYTRYWQVSLRRIVANSDPKSEYNPSFLWLFQ